MSTILTDDERPKLPPTNTVPRDYFTPEQMEAYADAREAAVLAKLAQQEPVAHRYRFGDVWMFDTYRWNGQDADEVVPVYEHPAPLKDEHSPCMGTNCGKTRYDQEHSAECIAETAKSQGWDTHPAPQQADVQAQQLAVLLDVRNSVVNNRCDGDTDFADGVEAANRNLLVRIDHMIKRTRQGYTHPVEETHAAEWPFAAAPEASAQASSYLEEVYEYLCSSAPVGFADEAFRLVPSEVLSFEKRNRISLQRKPMGALSREIPRHDGPFTRGRAGDGKFVAAPEAPAQASAVDERAAFEAWYSQNAFNFERDPIGSRECGLQWKAWQARAALAQKGGK